MKILWLMVWIFILTGYTTHTEEDVTRSTNLPLYHSPEHGLRFYSDPQDANKVQVWGMLLGHIATFQGVPGTEQHDLSTLILKLKGDQGQCQLRLDIETACHAWAQVLGSQK